MADTGVLLPYERDAMAGMPMPEHLAYPDQIAFQFLSFLYSRYRSRELSRDQAVQDKLKFLDTYRMMKEMDKFNDRHVKLIKDTEAARCAYRMDRTLENADKLVEAIDGIKIE